LSNFLLTPLSVQRFNEPDVYRPSRVLSSFTVPALGNLTKSQALVSLDGKTPQPMTVYRFGLGVYLLERVRWVNEYQLGEEENK
jgi:hypothetical protein